MNLFEFEKDKFEVTFSPMILNIPVFKKVIDFIIKIRNLKNIIPVF